MISEKDKAELLRIEKLNMIGGKDIDLIYDMHITYFTDAPEGGGKKCSNCISAAFNKLIEELNK